MLTLSDSALCADARDHRAITSRASALWKQAAAAVSAWSLTTSTLSFAHHNTHLPVATTAFFVPAKMSCNLIYRRNNLKVLPGHKAKIA